MKNQEKLLEAVKYFRRLRDFCKIFKLNEDDTRKLNEDDTRYERKTAPHSQK